MFIELIQSIIFGITQGATEFLPVSSSGHLVVLHKIMDLPVANELAFDVMLHFGTLLAVVFYFRQDLLSIIRSFFIKDKPKQKLFCLLVLSTLPAAAAGYFFEDVVANIFRSPFTVAFMLALVGLILIVSEKSATQRKGVGDITWPDALVIGLAQALALVPGTSRSGITIIAALFLGLKRPQAAKYSFLLSIPVIFGATVLQAKDLLGTGLAGGEALIYIIAFAAALASGWLAIRYFLRFTEKHRLDIFAYYRFALAVIIVIFLL